MKIPVVITDFTRVYDRQSFTLATRCARIDCTSVEGTDCYCDPEAEHRLRALLEPFPARGVHFLDSGNYHYLSLLWTEKIRTPFSLVVFDRHPDMQTAAFGEVLSCGSWVKDTLVRNPMLREVCVVGAAEELIAETEADCKARTTFCCGPGDPAWGRFLRVADDPVYVSVDKDVLDPAWASTNWDQGQMQLSQLEWMIGELARERRLIGADICGEYHPDEALHDETCIARNDRANECLLRLFLGLL